MYDTKDKCITYTNNRDADPQIEIYTDSDWGNNQTNRKSVGGYITYVFGNICSWKSSTQKHVALSSTDAEYVALSEGAREGLFIRNLVYECLGSNNIIHMKCDNNGAIKNAENEFQHKRAKHVDIKYHHIKEEIECGRVKADWVSTENNVADILTKPLGKHAHARLSKKLYEGMYS